MSGKKLWEVRKFSISGHPLWSCFFLNGSFGEFSTETQLSTISQSPRLMEWLCLEGTSGHHLVQPSCSKQDQLDQAQSHVQMSFEFLWGQRLHSHARQLVPVLDHPNIKRCFLLFKQNFLYFQMCSPWALLRIGYTSYYFPIRYLYVFERSPLSLHFSKFNSPSSQPLPDNSLHCMFKHVLKILLGLL